jgi:hypothetical protein
MQTDDPDPILNHDELGNEEVEELLPALKVVEYLTTWKLAIGKESFATRSLTRRIGSGHFHAFVSWMHDSVGAYGEEGYQYNDVKTDAFASYEKLPVSQWMTTRVQKQLDIIELENCIKTWATRWPHRLCRLDITAELTKTLDPTVDRNTADRSIAAHMPMSSSSIPPSTPSHRRSTATHVQNLMVSDMATAEEAAGNFVISLSKRWSCTNTTCRNHSYACWVSGSDLAQNHYPMNGEALSAWSQEIKRGDSTLEEPSTRTVIRLSNTKARASSREKKREPELHMQGSSTGQTVVFQLPQMPSFGQPYALPYGQFLPHPSFQHQASAAERSSPIHEDPDDLLKEFFNIWLVERHGWSQRDKEFFPEYRDGLLERGYNLDDLKDEKGIVLDRWVNWGFKEGHLGRLRSESQIFKSHRRASG